ncbi:PAS domain-containing sensor histidine kinase [Fibrisoma montanum]|uniref:histidine kinase n=1 Tax=Fibrisoma montanum TaxID=2305895 RepID=A0A418LWU6_9BACT|nr:PAS domain-containing sensor histidine kinase [Fibrisoma montanum]RIV17708.1 PAS domain-containing sensor histidine kinase [Fibrisoma montanum]
MLTDHYSSAVADLLFEKSDDFIGIYDLTNERFLRVNQAGVRLLGFASEEALLNDPVRSRSLRAQPLADELRMEVVERIVQTGHYEEEAAISRQDGTAFWGKLIINAFTANDRSYALIRLIDQGRLHRAERELAHSIRRNEAIFSYATIGIIVCDSAGRIVSANQLADRLFGYDPGELLHQTIEQLVPASVSRYHERLRHSFNADPQVRAMGHNRDLHAQRKDGSVFPVEISLSYFRLDNELYVVAYIVDITFKKEAERQLLAHRDHIERLNANLEQKVADRTHALMNTLEQLEQSKNELAKALAAERELGELKSRFVSLASHEFRTPLTAVLTSATLIEKYPGGDQQDKRQKHLDRIRTSVNHLNDILEEFLSVGKLEEGRIEARPGMVNIAQLVDETIASMRGMLKPGQTIRTDLSGDERVWLDPSLFRKILVNLLSNAIKYSGPESVVWVRVTGVDGQLTLSVEDQGIGISREDQEHLFERFFRARNVMNIAGTGLGLHIVGRYVELMGGRIDLQSELNQGTTITITLPYENHSPD